MYWLHGQCVYLVLILANIISIIATCRFVRRHFGSSCLLVVLVMAASGWYRATPEEVRASSSERQVSPDRARMWYEQIKNNIIFTRAMWIPMVWQGEQGIMPAVPSAASNRQYQGDLAANRDNRIVTQHGFLYYDCFWYPQMLMFNIAGISNPEFQGFLLPQNLGQILDSIASPEMRDWRIRFLHIAEGQYNDSFRRILLAFGVQYHIEMIFGLSMFAYMDSDAYVKAFHGDMPPPPSMKRISFSKWRGRLRSGSGMIRTSSGCSMYGRALASGPVSPRICCAPCVESLGPCLRSDGACIAAMHLRIGLHVCIG